MGKGDRGWGRGGGGGEGGLGVVGAGKGGGNNINYLVKITLKTKFFIFFCEIGRFCLPLYLSDFYFPWFGNFSFSVCLSHPLSHMKREVGRYVSDASNYNN